MAEGQDKKGKFQKGNKLAPGRPSKIQELAEYDRLKRSATPERLNGFLDKIWEGVAKGDKYCMQFVADRFYPAEYIADKVAGEQTSTIDNMLDMLKAKYIEAKVVTDE